MFIESDNLLLIQCGLEDRCGPITSYLTYMFMYTKLKTAIPNLMHHLKQDTMRKKLSIVILLLSLIFIARVLHGYVVPSGHQFTIWDVPIAMGLVLAIILVEKEKENTPL